MRENINGWVIIMINIEAEVFNTVATALRSEFTGIFVSGEYVSAPPSFPAAVGREMDNSTYLRSLDSSGQENHASVMWQWESFSNLTSGRKSQCKAIMAIIDTEMQKMGFIRIGQGPSEVPNADTSIYRMVARYRAVISTNSKTYRW